MVVAQYVLLLPRTWWGTLVHAVAVQAVVGVPMVLCEWSGRSQVGWGMFAMLLLLLVALVVFLCGLPALAANRVTGVRMMLWGLVGVAAGFGLMRLTGVARTAAFAECAQRAQPLVDAITRFEKERGRAPARLEELVPAYFGEVPGTGMPAYPRFELGAPAEGFTAATWELSIPCGLGLLNWDVFFYWPTQDYPRRIYGGVVQRIGTWAYVHE